MDEGPGRRISVRGGLRGLQDRKDWPKEILAAGDGGRLPIALFASHAKDVGFVGKQAEVFKTPKGAYSTHELFFAMLDGAYRTLSRAKQSGLLPL